MADMNFGVGASPPTGGNPEAIKSALGSTVGGLGLGSFEAKDEGLKHIHQDLSKVNEDLSQMKRTIDSLSPALAKLTPAFTKTIGLFSKLLGKNLGNNASPQSINTTSSVPDIAGMLSKTQQTTTTTAAEVNKRYGAAARAERAAGLAGQIPSTTTAAQVTFGTKATDSTTGRLPTSPDYAAVRAAKSGSTTAPVTGGAGGAAAKNLAAADKGEFGAGQQGGPHYGRAVFAQVAAETAGNINTAMASAQQNVSGLYTMGAQNAAVYGGTPEVNAKALSWDKSNKRGILSTSAQDLTGAVSALASNNLTQNQLRNKNLQGFMNTAETLNTNLGASGAANIVGNLTNNNVLWNLQQHDPTGKMWSKGALINPTSGGVNKPSETLKSLFNVLTQTQGMTPQQMTQRAKSNDWRAASQVGQQLGLSQDTVQLVKQFAASGGNLKSAEAKMSGTAGYSALLRSSEGTTKQLAQYSGAQGALKTIDNFAATVDQAQTSLLGFSKALDNAAVLGAKGAGGAFGGGVVQSLAMGYGFSKGSQLAGKALGKGLGTTAGKWGAGKAAGVLGKMAGWGGGGAGAASKAAGWAGRGFGRAATAITERAALAGGEAAATDAGYVAVGGLGATAAVVGGVALDAYLANKDYHLYFGMRAAQSDAQKAAKKSETADKKWANEAAGVWQDSPDGKVLAKRVITAGTQTGMRPGVMIINHHKKWFIDKDGKAQTKDTVNIHPAAKNSHATKGDPTYGLSVSDIPPMGDPGTGSTTTGGLQPQLSQRMQSMMRDNPNIKISSGHRTASQQQNLYNIKGGKGVARPGHSEHQSGKAVDVGPPSQFGWLSKNAGKYGLHLPAPKSEPWHLQAMGDASGTSGTTAAPITGADVVSKAQSYLGVDYSWGGGNTGGPTLGTKSDGNDGSHTVGLDCSGLVVAAYGQLGIQLPHGTHSLVNMGSAVSDISQALPGDLIFYNNDDHVAIYMGNGQQIAAPHTGAVVSSGPVDSGISAIRRISGVKGAAAAANAAKATGGGGVSADAVKKNGNSNTKKSSTAGGISSFLTTSFFSKVSATWLKGNVLGSVGMDGGSGGGGNASSTTAGGTNATSTSGGTSGAAVNNSVVNAVRSVTTNRLIQLAMLTGSALESNQNPTAAGGGAYGAWQIQMLKGRDVTPEQAQDPNFAAKFMLGEYTSAVHGIDNALWKTDPATAAEQAAYKAERPAADYFLTQGVARVSSSYNLAVSEVGGPMGDPVGGTDQVASAMSYTPSQRMGDPVASAMMYAPSSASSSAAGVSHMTAPAAQMTSFTMPTRGSQSSGPVTINMPIQVVGVSQQDAQHLAKMVISELKSNSGLSSVSRN